MIARPRTQVQIAKALSLVILATPFLMIGAGVWLVTVDFPNLVTMILGGILVACGVYVVPRPPKLREGGFTREELPALFALSDQIGARLGAEPITRIYLPEEINASYSEPRGERVLSFGLGLWAILTPEERVAVIAHELAHQVNGDVARSGVVAKALHVLEQWFDLFSPSEIVAADGYLLRGQSAEELFAGGVMGMLRGIVELVSIALLRLFYRDSQRAEYLADVLATKASGVEAAQSAMSKLALSPLVETELRGLVPSYVPSGTAFFDRVAAAVQGATEAERKRLFDKMVEEAHCVDMSHPPTFQRIAFLSGIAEPADGAIVMDSAAIDAEIAPILEARGTEVLQQLREY